MSLDECNENCYLIYINSSQTKPTLRSPWEYYPLFSAFSLSDYLPVFQEQPDPEAVCSLGHGLEKEAVGQI